MKVVIIGGVAAGASAAARLRRLDENAEIILLEKGQFISYANCGLPYHLGGVIPERDNLLVMPPAKFAAWFRVDVRIGSEAVRIDRERKCLTVRDSGGEYELAYDKLLLATGAVPTGGTPSDRVLHLWTLADMDKVAARLKDARRAVIAGAGFIGLEVAENLREKGLDVTIVQRGQHVLPTLDGEMAQPLADELKRAGIKIKFGCTVKEYHEQGDHVDVELDCGERIPADVVIVSTGVQPNAALARDCGLTCGAKGHIVVDETLRTSDPHIFAAGDVVEVTDPILGGKTAIPLAGPANKQGRIIADNICGLDSRYKGSQGSSILKVFDLTAAVTGINETQAKSAGIDADYVILSPMSHAGYYPGGKMMTMKVLFEKGTFRLLGAQIVGYEGVDKRIDVLATAIRAGMNAGDLKDLDLAYAPPYSSAKDPVNMAGFMIDNIANGVLKQWHIDDAAKLPRDGSVTLLDTRTVREYNRGHIENFVNIPLDELRERLNEVPKGKPVYVICQSGLRSYIASRILEGSGYTAYNFAGGFRFWDAVMNDRRMKEAAYPCGMDR